MTPEDKRAKLAELLRQKARQPKRAALSFSQERMWFLDRWSPGGAAFNMTVAVRLEGELDAGALQRGLQEVVQRHEVLRGTFTAPKARPVQLIAPSLEVALPVESLADLRGAAREQHLAQRIDAEARAPFDLAQGPLLRTVLFRLDAREHVLLVQLHHIVSDGWSMGILIRELAATYQAFVEGKPSPLPPLPVQYADFAAWQRDWLQGPVLEAQLAYWRARLSPNAILELPADKPRPAVLGSSGARRAVVLPPPLVQALRELSQREGKTLFVTLLAAFKVLLSRDTGQQDLAVGTPIAGRNRAELEGLIGLFANTLVLRTDLSGQPTFRELMGRVNETALGAFAHQDVPFEKLVDALKPERRLSHAPLFQVMFILQNAPLPAMKVPGLALSTWNVDSGTAKYDLTLIAVEVAEGLRLTAEYSTALFEEETIARLLARLQRLLEGIAAQPELAIDALPLLPDSERRTLLTAWNATACDFPRDTSIPALLEAQAARAPEALALVDAAGALTFAELNRRANQLAHHLRRLGVGPDSRVGVCVKRSVELGVALLGILKAGGAYVPLDPTYPRERLGHMLEDSGARVLVTQSGLESALPVLSGVTRVELAAPALAQESGQHLPDGPAPDNLAYVLYTSGSTGKPKGVLVPHRTVANFFAAMDARLSAHPRGVWLAVTSISFDISVLELWWTLSRGFTVVVQAETVAQGWLAEAVRRHGVTHLQCTPSLARALLLDEASAEALRHLRQLLVGGEALPPELARALRQRVPSLLNMYGPTETTVWSSTHPVLGTEPAIPLGTPIANTRLYVLDGRLQPAPIGVPGELFIAGEGVVRGYHGRPELTAERFLPEPFGAAAGARMYRTGDLARWRADGTVEFLGRVDFQVKVRGFRIELGEVEAVLCQHPAVGQAVVTVREDRPGEKRLAAYLVASRAPAPTLAELRAFLKERLPEYMVPAVFVVLEALPLTPNGKLDRRALPAPEAGRLDTGRAFEAPRTEVERLIADAWKEALQLERVSLDDPFFDLGGNSLLAVQLHHRLSSTLGVELALTELFQYPTVRGLAERIARRGETPDAAQSGRARADARRAAPRRGAGRAHSNPDGETDV